MRSREIIESELQKAIVAMRKANEEFNYQDCTEEDVNAWYAAAEGLDRAVTTVKNLKRELETFLDSDGEGAAERDSVAPMTPVSEWTGEKIVAVLDKADWTTVVKMLKALNARQTVDERSSGSTRWRNGIGFSGHDAPFATSLLRWFGEKHFFSKKQYHAATKMLKKYRGQLSEIANKEGW